MNFYDAIVLYEKKKTRVADETRSLFPAKNCEKPKSFFKEAFLSANNSLGVRCDQKEAFSVFFYEAEKGDAQVIYAVDNEKSDRNEAEKYIVDFLKDRFDICNVELISREITTEEFHKLGDRGDDNGYIKRYRNDESKLHIDYRDNRQYQIKEMIIPTGSMGLTKAKREAKKFLADESFIEELERIYSKENAKKYYGNPVHYKVSASNMESAMLMIDLLAHALSVNGRLAGRRMNRIYDIKDCCYDEQDFEYMMQNARGNIVVFDLSGTLGNHGNYASAYEEVIEYMSRLIKKQHVMALCIFVEKKEHPGFASSLLASLADEIDIIELNEGSGNREEAIAFIENLVKENKYEISREELEEVVPDKNLFTLGEIYEIYNKWFKNGLRNSVYKSYKHCNCLVVDKENKKSEPYDELQKMIGLKNIKEVVDEIIDSARVQRIRSDMGMDSYKTNLHMVFTGNPGSAKTTVARLLTQIFTKENIVSTGKFVECGRADLVGKYVGWTAKTVRNKFWEAKGGILFIDEAYSLVDDSNSFGDEAINTIVQEMENNRDDVIVIFAGYPDKMKNFLDKNEGLRSRIAFHLDFPDYSADELMGILKLMADKKGYKLSADIEDKCHQIFELAVEQQEFGNGRFARNLLEQAMMAQSKRIIKENKGKKISRKTLTTLKAEDFDVNASEKLKKDTKQRIGFC